MSLRRDIVAEARTWKGTPFHHRQGLKGVGVDCLHLFWKVGEAAGAMPPLTKRDLAVFLPFYSRRPNPVHMRRALLRFMLPIAKEEAGPGDVAWMHWGNQIPVHFAILGEYDGRPTLIHAVLDLAVVEHGFEAEHRRRVKEFWRYPRVADEVANG